VKGGTATRVDVPLGLRKLKQLRSSSLERRTAAASEFAAKVAEFLPKSVSVTFMPSSTRSSVHSDKTSIPYLVLSNLQKLRSDVYVIEPLVRASPVPSVHETRLHDVDLLKSSLSPVQSELSSSQLYVLDDMIATGATYTAFRAALNHNWPHVITTLLAYVYSPKLPRLFERYR
jgi:hypothetical protein